MSNKNWIDIINEEKNKDYYKKMLSLINDDIKNGYTIYPAKENIFDAMRYCSFDDTKVVILGQDPYINPNQAHGLSFSTLSGQIPPSLRNIFTEINNDIEIKNSNTNLTCWAQQGVLLLNTTLTVRKGESNSHAKYGWSNFTDRIISELNNKDTPVVFLLWGANAQSKEKLITNKKFLVLKSSHPSPLSCYTKSPIAFYDSKCFSKTNEFLKLNNMLEINWKT